MSFANLNTVKKSITWGTPLFSENDIEGTGPNKQLVPFSSEPPAGAGDNDGDGSGTQTLTRPKQRTKEPSFYKVLLLNDDFTPMDFVVHILSKFFNKSEAEAQQIMMAVHTEGSGIAGVFSHEVAETKVYLVNDYSRKHQHPLKCTMEKE